MAFCSSRTNDQVHLSEFRSSDKPALVQHRNDRDIYDRTLRIPFPYTDATADEWLALVARITEQQGRPVQFAIRSADDALIGACGLVGFQAGKSHRAEVGYWLATPYWGRGIMTAVVQRLCQHAFEEFAGFNEEVLTKCPRCGKQIEGISDMRDESDRSGMRIVIELKR